jgi:N-acetylneuraminic acid mutarotase
MDGVVGFSSGPAGSFAAEASIVRFSTRGFLDARNGGAYATDASIPYSAGTVYHFRLAVNIPAHTYSAFVTTGTSAEQLLASNYAFRTEQSTVSALNNLGVLADIGSESVCNLSISTTPAPNPVPLIAALSPSSATAGGPDFTLTVQGSNFISGSVVRWNGSDMTTVFVSGSTLTVSVPAGDISSVGTVMVTVFNPGPGGGLSSASTFTITANGSSDWVDTGSMSTGRFGHTATLLPNGRVLVAGGLGPWVPSFGPTRTSSPQASAEIYDSTSGGFIVISSMTFARTGHTATLLTNGKVLVAGGGTGGPELFDSALGVWSPTGALLTNRSNHTATLLANGKVLVAGGGVASAELYDPSVGTWSPAGVMSAMRSGNTATLLTSGKVLVCGGTSDGSAEVYDPATGSWSAVASMSTSRVNHTATLLPGGKVFVVGGGSASAEIFDPSIGTWSPAAPMSVVHAGFTATLLLDGQVLAAAGDLRSELYDPVLNVWSPPSYMSTIARSNHTATLLPSGKVLVVGGINSGGAMGSAMLYQANPRPSITAISSLSATAGDPGLTLTVRGNNFISGSVVRWSGLDRTTAFVSGSTLTASIPAGDVSSPGTAMVTVSNPGPGGGPSNQTFFSIFSAASPWMATGSMADYRGNHTSVVLGNGKVMVLWIGDRTEIYDPATGAWSPAALMSTARQLASATLLSNGKLLVAGGLVRGQPSVLAELYDPANDTWTPTGSMFSPRYGHAATLLLNGKVLVAGGAYTSAELYDPANGTWTPTGSVPISHVDVPATLLTDGRVLLAGGTGATVNESDIYDPATGTWAPTSPMSTARNGHTVTLLSNGKVLVAGGGANLSAELYDLATASWTLTTPMITSHYQHTATRLLDGRVLIAGGDTTGRSAELYDPVSGVWNSAGSMTVLRLGHRASLLPNGMVLVSGGFPLDPTNPLSSAELYRSTTPAASTSSFVDAFNQPDGLITNQNPASARSSKWLVTNGSLFASGAQGWTGVPDNVVPSTTSANGTGSAIFRALTVPSNIGSDVTVKVTVQSFVSAQPVGNWDGAHVYLRYLDARNYYQLSVYRRDGRAAIKKMLNGIESTFSTPLYGAAPIGTPQSARAVAINNTNGSVTLQLYVNGSLAASAVDTASPLTALGKVGMAGENTNFKFDDFTVAAPAGGTGVAAVLAAPPAALSFAPASQLVKSAYGGRVERIDATGVHVPENALTADSQITVEKAAETRDADAKRLRRLALRIQPATDEIEYMPSSAFFKEPVTVVLAYNPAKIAAAGLKEDELKVYFWNSALGDWDVLPSVVDKNAKTVSALTQHFSVYQVMAPGDGIVVSAGSPAFGLRAAYVFPNPARGTDAVTIRFQVGLADSVEVHVYDLSGRRVHASSGFTLNTGLDDGNGLGAQYTYDHVWNVSGVGSGVYRYVLTAKKSGHPDIHQTGKIGIVK